MKLFPLLALVALLLAGCASEDPTTTPPATNTTAPDEAALEPVAVAVSLIDRAPGVGVPPTTMGMTPNVLTLQLNVPVNLTVTNDGASAHNLVIDGLDVATDDLAPGESVSIIFTPKEAGDHMMYCSIGGTSPVGHSAQGMHGTVTVA